MTHQPIVPLDLAQLIRATYLEALRHTSNERAECLQLALTKHLPELAALVPGSTLPEVTEDDARAAVEAGVGARGAGWGYTTPSSRESWHRVARAVRDSLAARMAPHVCPTPSPSPSPGRVFACGCNDFRPHVHEGSPFTYARHVGDARCCVTHAPDGSTHEDASCAASRAATAPTEKAPERRSITRADVHKGTTVESIRDDLIQRGVASVYDGNGDWYTAEGRQLTRGDRWPLFTTDPAPTWPDDLVESLAETYADSLRRPTISTSYCSDVRKLLDALAEKRPDVADLIREGGER